MGRTVLIACLPWLGLLLACVFGMWLVLRLSGARLCLSRLPGLHRDQAGSVQSLSFVITLPLFMMILMFIVQVSQIMIGQIVVEYAAFAAARAAIVWIPAGVNGDWEPENCISVGFYPDPLALEDAPPQLDPDAEDFGPGDGGRIYLLNQDSYPWMSPKYGKIHLAAIMACVPISPSREVDVSGRIPISSSVLEALYRQMAPDAKSGSGRLKNKLAYASDHTSLEIRFFHPNSEPSIEQAWFVKGDRPEDEYEYRAWQELGWQAPLRITVNYNMALLPGPARFLAEPDEPNDVSRSFGRGNDFYYYPLTATAVLGNEGDKSAIPYEYIIKTGP